MQHLMRQSMLSQRRRNLFYGIYRKEATSRQRDQNTIHLPGVQAAIAEAERNKGEGEDRWQADGQTETP